MLEKTKTPMFSAGADEAYATLPVDVAYLRWTRGNVQARPLANVDPAAFLGGWKAMVRNRDGEDLPALPLPIVERSSEDGTLTFEVYATNVLHFLPINHRMRYEKRGKKTDPQTGRERTVILATTKKRIPGYEPHKQVFGLVYDGTGKNPQPAVLILDKWSSFITFQRAEQKFAKIKVPQDKALMRHYGTEGILDGKTNKVVPEFEVMGQSRSTPIQAIGLDGPTFVDITDEMTRLFYDSIDWAECPKWNAENANLADEGDVDTDMSKFLNACTAIGLTNVEIEQILAENGGSYKKALEALTSGETLTDVNEY